MAGLNANQRAVGNALEAAYATTLTGPAATLYTNLLMTGTPNALSQLSGEGITAAQNAAFAQRPHVRFPDDGSGRVLAQRRDRR